MSPYPDSTDEISRVCREAGFEVTAIKKVRSRVYKAIVASQADSGPETKYIKLHSTSRKSEFETFAAIATSVGHPPCDVVDADNYLCLVMDSAPGRPFSQLLPVVFLPGVWTYKQQQYVEAFQRVGRQLGRLHARTEDGTGPVLDTSEQQKAVDKTAVLEGHVDHETITAITNIFEKSSNIVTPYAITYGDRTPHNIVFDGKNVSQIDTSCKKRSTAYEHRGVVMGLTLMARRVPYGTVSKGRRLIDAYWNGYTQENSTSGADNAYFVRHLYGAIKLLNTYESPQTIESKLTKWIDPPILYDEIETAIQKITSNE